MTDSVPPLIEAEWLAARRQDDGLCLLHIMPPSLFKQFHIEHGIQSDYERWRSTSPAGVLQCLPDADSLSALISGYGINAQTHVVIIGFGESASDMSAACRVYWTLKTAGLSRLSVLNGGLLAYNEAQQPGQGGAPAQPSASGYQARIHKDWLADAGDVLAALENGDLLLDHRSSEEFLGLEVKEDGERYGTIPGALHLEYEWLTHMDSGRIRDVDTLKALYRARGIPLDRPHIGFCYTAHRSSLSWFICSELFGIDGVRMYDASMIEWSRNPERPMVLLVDPG